MLLNFKNKRFDLSEWLETRIPYLTSKGIPLTNDIHAIIKDFEPDIRWVHEFHKKQARFGTELPYTTHLVDVFMISASLHFKNNFFRSIALASLMHDLLEDTACSKNEVLTHAGSDVLSVIESLTKNAELPKSQQMQSSLAAIASVSQSIPWAPDIKISDRIGNLVDGPPIKWTPEKVNDYKNEAFIIAKSLPMGSPELLDLLTQITDNYTPKLKSQGIRIS